MGGAVIPVRSFVEVFLGLRDKINILTANKPLVLFHSLLFYIFKYNLKRNTQVVPDFEDFYIFKI